ncbi:NUDIX hydrolase [Methylacidiphilum sp. Yel]|uniref:NUDIX domain-containing protein n=1 Tax=Methylacidiphilum sp. Yel TaxID=1847730 RepID=UPI00106BE6C5|nr:NUDIX hydrolase [Methylacidiphilum sp. Yel]TFE68563.1 NUDIX hydrolase [Methylacidiphilum sp. Yel]
MSLIDSSSRIGHIGLRPEIARFALTTDCVVLGFMPDTLHLLLIQRKNPPFQGMWALPGGFVEENEDLEEAALRELKEETNISASQLVQIGAFGKPGRDPRGRVISIAFLLVMPFENLKPAAGDDAKNACFFPLNQLPILAFDHQFIIAQGCQKLLFLLNGEKENNPFALEKVDKKVFQKILKEALEKISRKI